MEDARLTPHSGRWWRPPACAALLLSTVVLWGCEGIVALDPEQVRTEVEAALEAYLPKLAAAYAEGDPSLLEGVAVEKEQAVVELRLAELASQGQIYDTTLKQLTVEDVRVDRTTAYVTTIEVWDIEVRTLVSKHLVRSYPDQRYRVRYQLKRQDGRWLVYFRNLQEEPAG